MAEEPWVKYPNIWPTKSKWNTWLRGQARQAFWNRFPPKIEWKKSQGYPPPSDYQGRAKRLGDCALCGKKGIPISQLEVDHIDEAGGFDTWGEFCDWLFRLIDVNVQYQLVEKECHRIKSYATKQGISFEQAKLEKNIIAFSKLPRTQQEYILRENGCGSIPKTLKGLKEAYRAILEDKDE